MYLYFTNTAFPTCTESIGLLQSEVIWPILRHPRQKSRISISTYWNGQAFYAGGSSTSGNVILGPKKKKFNVGDVFKVDKQNLNVKHRVHWFQAARDAGAEEVAPGAPGGAGGSGGTRLSDLSA